MADEAAALAAAPLELELDGKRYRFSPLSIAGQARLRLWAKDKPFEDYARQARILKGAISEEERARLFAEAVEKSKDEKTLDGYLDSQEGTAQAFGLMLRCNHPELTDADLTRLITADVEARVWRWLREVAAPLASREDEPKKGGGGGGAR
jgi:hypothetical protein